MTITFSQNLSVEKRIDEQLVSLDSISILTKKEESYLKILESSIKFKYKAGILKAGFKLMLMYSNLGQDKKVISIGSKIKKHIVVDGEDSKLLFARIHQINALALCNLGMLNDCRKSFKTAIKYAESLENSNKKNYVLSLCYENYTVIFGIKRFKEYSKDSILYYLNKSIEKANLIENKNNVISQDLKYDMIAFVYMRMAIHSLEQVDKKGFLELAEIYLNKALDINENYNILPRNKIMLLNQVSWLYMEKKEYLKSINYAKRSLKIEKTYKAPYHRVESFEFLASCYMELNKKEKAKAYLEKYSYLKDSIQLTEKGSVDEPLEKKITEVSGELNNSNKRKVYLIITIFLIISVALFIFGRIKNKKLNSKYIALIERLESENRELNKKNIIEDNNILINDAAVSTIIDKLNKFETSRTFLKKEVTLTWLANQFNTNTKYLSKTIKFKTGKKFRDYINGLRIDYITHRLYEDPKYREYKIDYLAKECGYLSSQVFVISFKKENNVTPSFFIKKLKQ